MGFHEVQFPVDISWGSRGGPGFSTSIVALDSGHEERVARWSSSRRTYDAKYGVKQQSHVAALIDFFQARLGPAYGFRYKDWSDYSTGANGTGTPTNADVLIGTGNGTTTQFQLVKRYTSGAVTRVRTIKKPVAGTTVVAVNGSGVGSGWTVNTTSGVLTFTTAPTNGHDITAGFQFDVPGRFGQELDEGLPIALDEYDNYSVGSIPIVEIMDEDVLPEEFPYGGSTDWGIITADTAITLQDGFTHVFRQVTTGLACILPAAEAVPDGGPLFAIQNKGTESLEVQNPAGTVIVTLLADQAVLCYTAFSTPNFFWYAT